MAQSIPANQPTKVDKDELRLKIKAVVGGIHTRSEYEELLLDIVLTYASQREIEAKLQMSANVFAQFKVAMMMQDLSARPPKGARFRTPLEELAIILSHEAPLSGLKNQKEIK